MLDDDRKLTIFSEKLFKGNSNWNECRPKHRYQQCLGLEQRFDKSLLIVTAKIGLRENEKKQQTIVTKEKII